MSASTSMVVSREEAGPSCPSRSCDELGDRERYTGFGSGCSERWMSALTLVFERRGSTAQNCETKPHLVGVAALAVAVVMVGSTPCAEEVCAE